MTYYMKLNPHPFEQIASGNKTIELRLNDEKRSKIQIGDTIVFTEINDAQRKVQARVTHLHRYGSFKELYSSLPLEKCGYSKERLCTTSYRDMDEYYSPKKQKQYGVLGIEIELL